MSIVCASCGRPAPPGRFCAYCGAGLAAPAAGGESAPLSESAGRRESLGRELAAAELLARELAAADGLGAETRRRALRETARQRAELLLAAARLHQAEGRWTETLAAAQQAQRLDPGNAGAGYLAGQAQQQLGQLDAAVASFIAAIGADPDWPPPRLALANLYESRGQRAEAVRELREYARLAGETPPGVEARNRAGALANSLPREEEPPGGPLADTSEGLNGVAAAAARLEWAGILSPSESASLQAGIAARCAALGLPPPVLPPRPAPSVSPPQVYPSPAPTAYPGAPQTYPAPPTVYPAPAPTAYPAAPQTYPAGRPTVYPAPASAAGYPRATGYPRPTDGGGLMASLLSVNLLHAMLYLGALLLLVSAVAITGFSWDTADSLGEWAGRQAVLTAAGALFFWIGGIVRERLRAPLAANGLLTIGALWVPVTVGHIVFRFIPARGETLIPGLQLALDLPTVGWLIISAAGVPVYALLAWRFRLAPMTMAAGAGVAASIGLGCVAAGLPPGWEFAAMTAAGPFYLLFSRWAQQHTDWRTHYALRWLAHLGAPAALLTLAAVHPGAGAALAVGGWSLALLYATARLLSGDLRLEYALFAAMAAAVMLTLGATPLPLEWHGLGLAGAGLAALLWPRLQPPLTARMGRNRAARNPSAVERPDTSSNTSAERPGTPGASAGPGMAGGTPYPAALAGSPGGLSGAATRIAESAAAPPGYVMGVVLTLAALLWIPLFAWEERFWAARLATVHSATAALRAAVYLFRRQRPLANYLVVAAAAFAIALTLERTELPPEYRGLALLGLAAVYLLLGRRVMPAAQLDWGERWNRLLQPPIAGAAVLMLVGLLWYPAWEAEGALPGIATLLAIAVLLAGAVWIVRPYAWPALLPAGAALAAAAVLGGLELGIGQAWAGMPLAALAALFWAAAETLRAYPKWSAPQFRPAGFPADGDGGAAVSSPIWRGPLPDSASLPLYLLAAGSVITPPALAAIWTWDDYQTWPVAAALAPMAVGFALAAYRYGNGLLLHPALAAWQLGLAQAVFRLTGGSWEQTGAWHGLAALALLALGAMLSRKPAGNALVTVAAPSQADAGNTPGGMAAPSQADGGNAPGGMATPSQTYAWNMLTAGWPAPFWVGGGVGLLFSLATSLLQPETGLMATGVFGLAAGGLAFWRRQPVFAYAAVGLLLGGVTATALWLAGVAPLHGPVYGIGAALAVSAAGYGAARLLPETRRREQWGLWASPLRAGALGIAAVAPLFGFAYAAANGAGELLLDGGLGRGEFEDFLWPAAALAGSGLTLVWWGFVDRSLRQSYGGLALTLLAYLALLLVFDIGQPLYFIVPPGVFLLGVAYAERRWGQRAAGRAAEIAGLLLLLGATLGLSIAEAWNYFGEDGHFYYGLWLFGSGLAVIGWGAAMRWKRTFLGGLGAFTANLLTLLSFPVQLLGGGVSWWWIALGLALAIVGGAVLLELRREQLLQQGRAALQRLAAWD